MSGLHKYVFWNISDTFEQHEFFEKIEDFSQNSHVYTWEEAQRSNEPTNRLSNDACLLVFLWCVCVFLVKICIFNEFWILQFLAFMDILDNLGKFQIKNFQGCTNMCFETFLTLLNNMNFLKKLKISVNIPVFIPVKKQRSNEATKRWSNDACLRVFLWCVCVILV